MTLTPGVIALLGVLQFRCGVSIDFVNADLQPVPTLSGDEIADAIWEPGLRDLCHKALNTGEARVHRDVQAPIALYPVRHGGHVVGLLILTPRGGRDVSVGNDEYLSLETLGHITRATVENDLATSAQLAHADERTRRTLTILRFISQVGEEGSEQWMLDAVVQAAAVWFDLDCRIYSRESDGQLALFAALPDVARGNAEARLDPARLGDTASIRRVFSPVDSELSDVPVRLGDVLALSIEEAPGWVMLLNGLLVPDVELTFRSIAAVVAGKLSQFNRQRLDRWQDRLLRHVLACPVATDRVLALMLNELGEAISATRARLSLGRQGQQRTVSTGATPPADAEGASPHIRVFDVDFDEQAHLELWGHGARIPFDAAAQVNAWIAAVQPWLCGVSVQGADSYLVHQRMADAAFERRVQEEVERATRFDLGLSLVLVSAESTDDPESRSATADVLGALRAELRASDIIGSVRGGLICILLVQVPPAQAPAVAGRLQAKLASAVGKARIGHSVLSPECPSAAALIAVALGRLADKSKPIQQS